MNKKIAAILSVTVVCAVLFTGCSGKFSDLIQTNASATALSPASSAVAAPEDNRSKMSVSTTESVSVVPDMAYLTIGTSTQGSTAEEAMQQNNVTANAILEAVKAQGVAEEDVQTSNLNIYKDYNDPTKYDVEITYTITINDINSVGKVMDSAIAAGANISYSISFDLKDRDSVYMEALQKAMQSITDKAEKMAEAGGLTIDKVLQIDEGSNDYGVMYSTAMKADGAADSTSVSPGQLEVSATVTATYLLK